MAPIASRLRSMKHNEIKRVVAYHRVSTREQGISGLGLEAQRTEAEAECQRRGWQIVNSYTDVSSGRKMNGRHQLAQALKALADRKADALVVTKVDRLARSPLDFYRIADSAKRQGWALVVLAGGIDMSTSQGKAMAGMMGVFAELEAEMIGERTKIAMAVSKIRGPRPAVVEDGKIIEPAKLRAGRPRVIDLATENRIVRMRRKGASFQAIATKLDSEQVPTSSGRPWHWSSVKRVVRRHIDEPVTTRRRRVGIA